jgi:hypothetical protein
MESIEYHGWRDCVRLANDVVEIIASKEFGPRIMRFGFVGGGANVFGEEQELYGKTGPADTWVNYGGHRLWHAPEIMPRTYEPDNAPVEEALFTGATLILKQRVEPTTGIGKQLCVTLGGTGSPVVKVDHILTNHNPWPIELAPWGLSVVAAGGRVILPQEPFQAHGEGDNFAPARPLVLWPFADMADSRWTWGSMFVQLRSDAGKDNPQKIGVFSSPGWAAFHAADGDLFLTFVDTEELGPEDFTDMGCNFETYTKGEFQELETLGPLELLDPGEAAVHTEHWVLMRQPTLPIDDAGLAGSVPAIVERAKELIAKSFPGG